MASIIIQGGSSGKVGLKPMLLAPAASFTFHNDLGVPVKITTQGKEVRLEKA